VRISCAPERLPSEPLLRSGSKFFGSLSLLQPTTELPSTSGIDRLTNARRMGILGSPSLAQPRRSREIDQRRLSRTRLFLPGGLLSAVRAMLRPPSTTWLIVKSPCSRYLSP